MKKLDFQKIYESAVVTEGAWGYKTNQNDQGLDLFDEITDPNGILSRLKEKLGQKDRSTDETWHKLCAADMVVEMFGKCDSLETRLFDTSQGKRGIRKLADAEIAKGILQRIAVCEKDREWRNSWSEPAKLDEELQQLRAVYSRMSK